MEHCVPNERLYLDRICMVPVFAEPVTSVSEFTRIGNPNRSEHSIKIHLRVVDEVGELFTELGLHRMCLGRAEILHLKELCERRLLAISKKYLPRGTTDIIFIPEECTINAQGRVHITFYVSGRIYTTAHV